MSTGKNVYAWECKQVWNVDRCVSYHHGNRKTYTTHYNGYYLTKADCELACEWHAVHGSGPHPRPRRICVPREIFAEDSTDGSVLTGRYMMADLRKGE
jgi:hypothetical protein